MSNAFLRIGHGDSRVLVLHGWFSDHRVYMPTYPWLDTDRFSYVFVDAPGYGGSVNSEYPRTIEGMGRQALAVADELGWTEFAVVGHSMGGKAAQWCCAYGEGRVTRAVGVTPVPASGVPLDDEGRGLFESAAHDDTARKTILDMTTGGRLGANWLDRMARESFAACDEQTFGAYFQDWAGQDFSAGLSGNRTPFLALVGENDGAITEEVMRQTVGEWMPEATIENLSGAGHYPMVETPPWLVSRIENFLG